MLEDPSPDMQGLNIFAQKSIEFCLETVEI